MEANALFITLDDGTESSLLLKGSINTSNGISMVSIIRQVCQLILQRIHTPVSVAFSF